jgi:hypothetical protein
VGLGLLGVVLLKTIVHWLIPGGAIAAAVMALLAWRKQRHWARTRAASAWLLAPWAALFLLDLVFGFGAGVSYAAAEISSLKPAVLSPAVGALIVLADLIQWTVSSGRRAG